MEQTPFVGFVLWATDVPALSAFLLDVCGLEVVEEYPGYAKLHSWNAVVELHGDDAADRRHPWYRALAKEGVARGIGTEFRIRVAGVDAAYARALARGALGLQQPTAIDGTYQGTVMGPDGYCFTLWE